MKIFRPDDMALMFRSFRFARRNTLAVGMLALFRFDASERGALLTETELWAAAAEAMGSDAVLDEGYPKPVGEFAVYGSAWAAQGAPVEEMGVSVQIGALRKQLVVNGDRVFNALGLASDPSPFYEMPLTPAHAFGGPGYAANPLGKGAQEIMGSDGEAFWPLPNVETLDDRMVETDDEHAPAGFWCLPPHAPVRAAMLGRFDDSWLRHTWPHLPEDTQAEYFQTAPADQRLTAYFSGDETMELRGMHPQHQVLTSHLPGLRARCFINRSDGAGGERFSELQTRAESVWLFPGAACGIVLYRGQSDIADEDGSDVLHIMAEWERMTDAPASFDHYQRVFRERLDEGVVAAEPTAEPVIEATAPAAALVVPAPAAAAAGAVAMDAGLPDTSEIDAVVNALERDTAEKMARHGLTPADLQRVMPVEPSVPPATLEEVDRVIVELNAETQARMQQHGLTQADLAPVISQAEAAPASASVVEVNQSLRQLEAATQQQMQKHGLTEADVERLLAANPNGGALLAAYREALAFQRAEGSAADMFAGLPALPEIDIAQALPEVALLSATLPKASHPPLTREQVVARRAAGETISGFDLSGVDLSGLDLSGADFSDSLMEGVRFADSLATKANFTDCLLKGADFTQADCSQATFLRASVSGSKFTKARLSHAVLQDADFTGADFVEASLGQASLAGATFEAAVMTGLSAAGVQASSANFTGADLSGADLRQAVLTDAMFVASKLVTANFHEAQASGADFQGAVATGAQFAQADLAAARADKESNFSRASFEGAQLHRAAWEGARLTGAQFSGARLDFADFSQTQAQGANFRNARARGVKLSKADLSKADMTGVDLLKGSLRKARVEDAALHFANLYGVDFEGVTVKVVALEGADTGGTILGFRPPLA